MIFIFISASLIFLYSACKVSGMCSRNEEYIEYTKKRKKSKL